MYAYAGPGRARNAVELGGGAVLIDCTVCQEVGWLLSYGTACLSVLMI
jgi:hypothetical protein